MPLWPCQDVLAELPKKVAAKETLDGNARVLDAPSVSLGESLKERREEAESFSLLGKVSSQQNNNLLSECRRTRNPMVLKPEYPEQAETKATAMARKLYRR